MKEASNIYNIQNVELKNISKENGHPNKLGMLQIREQLCNEAFDRLFEIHKEGLDLKEEIEISCDKI